MRVSIPQLMPGGQSMSQWQAMGQLPGAQYAGALSAPARSSWDLQAYLEAGPQASATAGAQSLLQRGSAVRESEQAPAAVEYPTSASYGQRTSSG